MPAVAVSLALLALACGVLPLGWAGALLGLAVLLAAALALPALGRSGRRLGLAAVLLLLWLWGLQAQPAPGPGDPVGLIPLEQPSAPVRLQGQLLGDPQAQAGGGCRVLLQAARGRTELSFSRCPSLREGWHVEVQGRLRRPRPASHPLLAGPAERLVRQGVWSQLRVQHWQVLSRPFTPVADLRRHMAEALLAAGGAEAGAVLAALVLGSAVVAVPLPVREAFRVSGLSHALAASGFHLTVLLGVVMACARHGPKPLRWVMALGAMLLFLLLAGPQPSVVRAVAMGAMAFAVQESGRRVRPLGVLLLCGLLMLVPAPRWLLDVGFQLSMAATAGLMLCATPLELALRQWRLPGWLAGGLAVPVAASLWTLPLQLLHFGSLPPYAVAANLVVAPLLSPLTLGAMALALAAVLLPPLVTPLAWPLVPMARVLIAVARWFAALPMAQWSVGRPLPGLVLLLSLGLLPWLLPRREGPRQGWWRPAGLGLLVAAVSLHLGLLRGDQVLAVQEGPRHWLLARHGGRAALVSLSADALSCSRARQLALGVGVQRFDWLLLLDPVAPAEPACWQPLSATTVQGLQQGQRLLSPGLEVRSISPDSQALLLQAGRQRWGLLPDRQALWSWRRLPLPPVDRLWWGFKPSRAERQSAERG